MDPLLGRTLDNKYLVERLLGKGGMGSVYLALHTGTKRSVAVKVIAPQFMRNKELLIRFQREAEATGRLSHPNVVNVTDFGVTIIDNSAVAYLVMEYLEGETLHEFLQKNPLPPPDFVLDVLEQTALGITEAHGRGILHRDLKPQNIWLQPDGRGGFIVKVLDFGIAKLADPSALSLELPELEAAPNTPSPDAASDDNATVVLAPTELGLTSAFAESSGFTTTFGSTLGTPAFMSPEQCAGKSVSERSDLYSLAMISYLMLAGELPFKGTARELIEQQLTLTPDAPHTRNTRLSEGISRAILESLSKDPDYRAPNLLAFVARLRSAIHGEVELLKESRTAGTHQSGAWFGFLVAAAAPVIAVLVATRLGASAAVEKKWVPVEAAVTFIAAFHFVLSYLALVLADTMMARWVDALRSSDPNLRLWWNVVQKSFSLAGKSVYAVLGTMHWIRSALAHIVVTQEQLPVEDARIRSQKLLHGNENIVWAILVRRVAVTCLVVGYYPAIMMSLRVPIPIIVREYLQGGIGSTMSLLSFSFLPIYGSFLSVWFYLYERGKRSLGEPVATADRRYQPSGARVGERIRLGTKVWTLAPVSLLAVLFVLPQIGWNDTQGDTLPLAAIEGRLADVERFLAQGVDPNEAQGRSRPPLVSAVQNGNRPLAELLLARGASATGKPETLTPLHAAVLANRPELLHLLLDHRADVNVLDNTGDTPLTLAAKRGDAAMVKILLARGANRAIKNHDELLPIDHARRLGHGEVVALLAAK